MNGTKIRSEAAYVLAICERYDEPEPPLKPKATDETGDLK